MFCLAHQSWSYHCPVHISFAHLSVAMTLQTLSSSPSARSVGGLCIQFFTIRQHRFQICEGLHSPYRLRGRVDKGVGHLGHVWSYGVREVVSSIPDRGNIVGWLFSSDQVTGKVFSSEHAFPSKYWIYLDHCPRGEAVITGHLRVSFRLWGSQPRKKLSFRPLLLLLLLRHIPVNGYLGLMFIAPHLCNLLYL